jgi:two-component system chemotaxis response regulator CheB
MLDDGTAGCIAIKKCIGIRVVQDPRDAAYPEMPQSALNNTHVDHCVPIAEMGLLLERLTQEHPGKITTIPKAIQTEALIAERVLSNVAQVNGLGQQVPYNCPNRGGVLWEMNEDERPALSMPRGQSISASHDCYLDSVRNEDDPSIDAAASRLRSSASARNQSS